MKDIKLDLDWSVLPHPPYSQNLALSDFHLFHSLQNTMKDIKLDLDWSVLPHPPYSQNLALNDFHLFHSVQNVLPKSSL